MDPLPLARNAFTVGQKGNRFSALGAQGEVLKWYNTRAEAQAHVEIVKKFYDQVRQQLPQTPQPIPQPPQSDPQSIPQPPPPQQPPPSPLPPQPPPQPPQSPGQAPVFSVRQENGVYVVYGPDGQIAASYDNIAAAYLDVNRRHARWIGNQAQAGIKPAPPTPPSQQPVVNIPQPPQSPPQRIPVPVPPPAPPLPLPIPPSPAPVPQPVLQPQQQAPSPPLPSPQRPPPPQPPNPPNRVPPPPQQPPSPPGPPPSPDDSDDDNVARHWGRKVAVAAMVARASGIDGGIIGQATGIAGRVGTAAEMGGPWAAAAVGVAEFARALADSIPAAHAFAGSVNAANMRLAPFSGRLGAAMAAFEIGEMRRTMDLARRTGEGGAGLALQYNQAQDAWQNYSVLSRMVSNEAGSFAAGYSAEAGRQVDLISRIISQSLNRNDPSGSLANAAGTWALSITGFLAFGIPGLAYANTNTVLDKVAELFGFDPTKIAGAPAKADLGAWGRFLHDAPKMGGPVNPKRLVKM